MLHISRSAIISVYIQIFVHLYFLYKSNIYFEHSLTLSVFSIYDLCFTDIPSFLLHTSQGPIKNLKGSIFDCKIGDNLQFKLFPMHIDLHTWDAESVFDCRLSGVLDGCYFSVFLLIICICISANIV